jgi:hypothetical protein
MMSQTSSRTRLDWDVFVQNQNLWTYEQFEPYRGHWVAWSLDGKSIVAHHADLSEVVRTAEGLGFSSEQYLLDVIPADDRAWL